MKTCLVILGGLRIGDCWHMIPILNKLTNDGYTIDWIAGSYEKSVAECLAEIFHIRTLSIVEDNFPTDIHGREDFLNNVKNLKYPGVEPIESYDFIFDYYKSTFEFEPNWQVRLEETYLPKLPVNPTPKDHVVVQADSISACKRVDGLFQAHFKYPVLSVGGRLERILPGSYGLLGRPWKEVLQAILEAKLYVGIHSAATCLAFYTGTPMIVVDFGQNLDFTKYGHSNIVQLSQRPSAEAIQEAIDKMDY